MGKSKHKLPLPSTYTSEESYIADLLAFLKSNRLHQLLCGGVHILDFFTRFPDLYEELLEEDWRQWFDLHSTNDLVHFILHEDLLQFGTTNSTWRGKPAPPSSLIEYLSEVRKLLLRRDPASASFHQEWDEPVGDRNLPHTVAMGMKDKKRHEVTNFASYVDSLAKFISSTSGSPITHLVDFGSGQNYLGRALASEPYNWNVIAVESKSHNVESARSLDVHARLAPKKETRVNKKAWRAGRKGSMSHGGLKMDEKKVSGATNQDRQMESYDTEASMVEKANGAIIRAKLESSATGKGTIQYVEQKLESGDLSSTIDSIIPESSQLLDDTKFFPISPVTEPKPAPPSLMVISLHSCGNLSHHGIRSLLLNPSVKAVAIVGCCYNLLTESFTAPSYKLPCLDRRAQITFNGAKTPKSAVQPDAHGFPMSHLFRTYELPASISPSTSPGINLNITSRMMAVQAPSNWTSETSSAFFTRHFYRALLQRVFLDCGVVGPPSMHSEEATNEIHTIGGRSAAGTSSGGVVLGSQEATQPIVIGSLRKACYTSFASYVRGALSKLTSHHVLDHLPKPSAPSSASGQVANDELPTWAPPKELSDLITQKTSHLTDADIERYEQDYASRRKQLSIVWTLMAFSAGVVEAAIVVDRFCWLREQGKEASEDEAVPNGASTKGELGGSNGMHAQDEKAKAVDAWVEPVFDYGKSPRNLVVVGVKG